jgi:hypothetical protein
MLLRCMPLLCHRCLAPKSPAAVSSCTLVDAALELLSGMTEPHVMIKRMQGLLQDACGAKHKKVFLDSGSEEDILLFTQRLLLVISWR